MSYIKLPIIYEMDTNKDIIIQPCKLSKPYGIPPLSHTKHDLKTLPIIKFKTNNMKTVEFTTIIESIHNDIKNKQI